MNHHYTIDTPLSYHDYNIINHFKYNTSYIQLQYTHHSPHFCTVLPGLTQASPLCPGSASASEPGAAGSASRRSKRPTSSRRKRQVWSKACSWKRLAIH